MLLKDAIDARLPLAVRTGAGSDRIMAEAFVVPAGVSFVEPYWRDSNAHPCNLLKGEIFGDGPWTVGDAVIREILPGDPLAEEWRRWSACRRSPGGATLTRQAAWLDMQTLEE